MQRLETPLQGNRAPTKKEDFLMNITFSNQKIFSSQQVNDLYTSVGWTAYTNDLPKLLRAISKSSLVISAWNGEELVGLIRALTDEETIAYIQDILVLPVYHKQGVGSQLMRRMLAELKGIRQIVLMTDQGEANLPLHDWYRSFGFKFLEDWGTIGFAIFDVGEAEVNL